MTKEMGNIDGYNAKHKLPMPYIVVVVDEMSDLMLVAGKEIGNYIQKLSQWQEQLVFILLWQHKDQVLTSYCTIKANFPTRILFK